MTDSRPRASPSTQLVSSHRMWDGSYSSFLFFLFCFPKQYSDMLPLEDKCLPYSWDLHKVHMLCNQAGSIFADALQSLLNFFSCTFTVQIVFRWVNESKTKPSLHSVYILPFDLKDCTIHEKLTIIKKKIIAVKYFIKTYFLCSSQNTIAGQCWHQTTVANVVLQCSAFPSVTVYLEKERPNQTENCRKKQPSKNNVCKSTC